jgi:hypothetical protein
MTINLQFKKKKRTPYSVLSHRSRECCWCASLHRHSNTPLLIMSPSLRCVRDVAYDRRSRHHQGICHIVFDNSGKIPRLDWRTYAEITLAGKARSVLSSGVFGILSTLVSHAVITIRSLPQNVQMPFHWLQCPRFSSTLSNSTSISQNVLAVSPKSASALTFRTLFNPLTVTQHASKRKLSV